ncbi:MAG TPA: DUF2264 domain-containing protein [Opitutaceae bacterium]
MKTRREFVRLAVSAGVLGGGLSRAAEKPSAAGVVTAASLAGAGAAEMARADWCRVAGQLASPLLRALAARRLKATMPVESHPSSTDRPSYTHLEALGRLLAGLAPWLERGGDASDEGKQRAEWAALARAGIDAATDPASPDFLNFSQGRQPLVDAAFLAQALRRAPGELWGRLEPRVRQNVIAALRSSRVISPPENNWTLFATTVEVFLSSVGEARDEARLFDGLRKHRAWYLGDGVYGDGPEFHWDYYNAFVIQPMLLEALDAVGDEVAEWGDFRQQVRARLTRYAEIQERLVAPDGSYPAVGRSIAYRCGAFQVLAQAALRRMLPAGLAPAQARVALGRVIRRTLGAPETFDEQGWLRIGLSGAQPGLGEPYISTGSLYLCSVALLPLGLPPEDPFWSGPAVPTSWERVWAGENLSADHALKG